MAKRTINILTADPPKLDLIISANLVDSYILSVPRTVERDMLSEPYLSLCKSIGYGGLIQEGVVQTARYSHPGMVAKQIGYGGKREDFIGDADNEFDKYGNGVLVKPWQSSFDEKAFSFAAALGLYCDLCANVEHGTYEELDFRIQYFKPRVIFFGAEVATYMTAAKYKEVVWDWVNRVRMDYPDIICVLIPGLIYRENPKSIELSNTVAIMDGDGHNQYFQIRDRIEKEGMAFTSDMELNAEVIDIYFSSLLDYDVDNCKELFGDKKMYIGEWNHEDNRRDQYGREVIQYVNNTPLAMSAIGRMFEYCIANNDYIKYLAWMSHSNLIGNDNSVSNHYLALKTCAKMTNGRRKITQVESTGLSDDIGITTVKDGKHHYCLINNKTQSESVIDEIYVDGKLVTVPVLRDGYFGASWGGRVDVISGTGTGAVEIPARSMQVVDFTI